MLKKIIIGLIALVLVAVGIGYAFGGTANASEGDQPCVPSDAYDEVIHHDAVTHVVHHDAVTHVVHHDAVTHVVHHDAVPAGPNLWWNWSPNHHQGPFDGPPAFPVDDRGTWEGPHENGGPSQDTFGTFQQGEGHGSWFHREHGTPGVDAYDETVVDQEAYDETVVDSEAYDETVVDQEAYDEVIHHDAVVCPPNPGDQPPPIITTTHTEHHEKCAQYYSTDDITTTINYVLSEDGSEWVQGEPVVTDVFNTWVDPNYDPSKCENTPPPPHHDTPTPQPAPPVKHSAPTPVPTVIEAGL